MRSCQAFVGGVAFVLALLIALGCGGEDGETPGFEPLTTAQLRARLLTVADLPAGYTRSRETDTETQLRARNPECDPFLNAEKSADTAAEVDAFFEQTATGPLILETVGSYKTVELARADFARARRLLERCGPIRFDDPEIDGAMTVTQRTAPDLGDETLAYTLQGEVSADDVVVPVAGDLLFVRLGGNAVQLGYVTLGSAAPTTIDELMRLAVRRFRSPRGA